MNTKTTVFWGVMPCNVVDKYQSQGGTHTPVWHHMPSDFWL